MKERLTGAIILVALIVVLVPELLSGPIRPAARAHSPGSSAEEPPLRSYTINLADEAHGGGGTAQPQPSAPPSPTAPAAEPAAAPPAAPPGTPQPQTSKTAPPQPAPPPTPAAATAARPPPPSAPTAAPAATSSGSAGGWVVQLGSFANRSNAEGLAQQLRTLGYPVSVSRGSTGRRLYRVQAGPTHERTAAEQLAAKLRAQGHNGSVMRK